MNGSARAGVGSRARRLSPPDSHAIERTAQAAFDYRARRSQLSERDRAFAAELAYGAIKMRRALDWQLQPFVSAQLPPAIREILRLAMYGSLYTRADVHATVFEFVNLANATVTAVWRTSSMRFFAICCAPIRPICSEHRSRARTSTWGRATRCPLARPSVARDLRRRLEAVCAGVNRPAQPAIVVNAIKSTVEEVAERLRADGVEARRSPIVGEVLLVERGFARVESEARWWPQSESSAMAVDVLGPQPGEAILDVCSGRGNKALQIGARLAGDGELFCIERDERRVATLARRLDEAGMTAALVTGDASTEVVPADRRFDRVLVDAPCSGLGVVGRHPEARWKKQGTDGERLALTQRALLEQAARHVYPGGALVYAVCSTDPRETSEVIDWFLARQNFERGVIPAEYASLSTRAGDVLVPPGLEGRDGFYFARVERRP